MKILQIETGMNLYGGPQQVLYLLQGLRDRGVTNLLVCPNDSAIGQAAAPYVDKLIHVSLRKGLNFGFYKYLREILARERPDLVHVHSRRRGADWWAVLAARKAGIPAIVSRRVDNPEPRWLARWKYGLYTKVVAISEGIRQVLLQEGIPPEHVVTVRSAVDSAPYLHDCECEEFRQTFGLPEEAVTLAVIAQLIQRKGHRHLFAVLPEIIRRHPETRVLVFGKGGLRQTLEDEVLRVGLKNHVLFAGFRTDLARWLPCVDIVVHPADMEGLGVSLLQASASAVPVVATRAGGIPEAVEHGVTGLVIEPGDPTGLQAAILTLLDAPEMRKAMGLAGRIRASKEFSTSHMVEGNLAIYREALGINQP